MVVRAFPVAIILPSIKFRSSVIIITVNANDLIWIGLVFFTVRWWDPAAFAAMHPEGTSPRASWPYVEHKSYLWTWLFVVPLVAYTLWQVLYFLIVNVLRRQRLLRDPEVMTSYRFFLLSLYNFFCNRCLYNCGWPFVSLRSAPFWYTFYILVGNSQKRHRKQIMYGGA